MTDTDVVVRCALACEGASEVPANTNAGPFVERCQAVTGNKRGDPWCASFVAMVGAIALGARWPLPKTGGCQVLYEFGVAKGIVSTKPSAGATFLIWHPELGRFAHTGFCLDANGWTISGNTSGAGSREGWIVGKRLWTFKPEDRFLDYAILLS